MVKAPNTHARPNSNITPRVPKMERHAPLRFEAFFEPLNRLALYPMMTHVAIRKMTKVITSRAAMGPKRDANKTSVWLMKQLEGGRKAEVNLARGYIFGFAYYS